MATAGMRSLAIFPVGFDETRPVAAVAACARSVAPADALLVVVFVGPSFPTREAAEESIAAYAGDLAVDTCWDDQAKGHRARVATWRVG